MKNESAFHKAVIVCAAIALLSLASCQNPSTSAPAHTYQDASATMMALAYGIIAAGESTTTSDPAYNTQDASAITFHFNDYVYSNGITLKGTLTVDMADPFTENGTIFASGGNVKQITYNNITLSPLGGTYEITFTDNSMWIYDYATGTFTGL